MKQIWQGYCTLANCNTLLTFSKQGKGEIFKFKKRLTGTWLKKNEEMNLFWHHWRKCRKKQKKKKQKGKLLFVWIGIEMTFSNFRTLIIHQKIYVQQFCVKHNSTNSNSVSWAASCMSLLMRRPLALDTSGPLYSDTLFVAPVVYREGAKMPFLP